MLPTAFEHAVGVTLEGIRSIAGDRIRYTHGNSGGSYDINGAVQGDTQKGTIEVGGAETICELSEFLIRVDQFRELPKQGDRIERTIGQTTHVWSVEARFTGEAVFDWSDYARTTIRVRCRKEGEKAFEVSNPSGFDLAGNEIREQGT